MAPTAYANEALRRFETRVASAQNFYWLSSETVIFIGLEAQTDDKSINASFYRCAPIKRAFTSQVVAIFGSI
jgi:hypothetical protein